MDDKTLEVILSRFDILDAKIDGALAGQASPASRVTATETKVEPVVSEATFHSSWGYIGRWIDSKCHRRQTLPDADNF